MERLRPEDAWFLYLEGPTVHLHVTGLMLLDPSTAPKGFSFDQLRRYVAGRLDLMPMLRQRLVEAPLAIDHPYWIEDSAFDIDNHVHSHVLSGGGSMEELAAFIGDFASTQLDRSRPLWDLVLVEGLDDGNVAIVMKMHHCIVDGVSGMDVMAHLLDLSPSPKRRRRASVWEPEALPTTSDVLAAATWSRATSPLRPLRAAAGVTASLVQLAATTIRRRLEGADSVTHPLNAPRTRFNASISADRVVAFGLAPLEDLKIIRRAFGVTINEVVLAACTYGLRGYLEAHDRVPDQALVCSVPVSTRAQSGGDRLTNQLSTMFVSLPVHLADPLEQLRAIHGSSLGAKEVQSSVGVDMIRDVVEMIPASLFHLATRLYSQTRLADRLAPIHNLVVSNVMGSPVPLYMAGAKVVAMYPFGPLMEGTGLNVTVLSNTGEMNIGLIACPDLVPDLDHLLDEMLEGIAVLLKTAEGAAWGTSADEPPLLEDPVDEAPHLP
jgi:diacylglycerol O-acyltransferase